MTIGEHLEDLTGFLSSSPATSYVIVAHSFAGLLLQKLLLSPSLPPNVKGAAFLCSVPPSGNGPMALRYLQSNLGLSYKVTRGLAAKGVCREEALARELFFDDSMEEKELQYWMKGFERDSRVTIDLGDLSSKLPGKDGDLSACGVPLLVLGASGDRVVDRGGVLELASFAGVEPVFVDSPHDVMLGGKAGNAAGELEAFLKGLGRGGGWGGGARTGRGSRSWPG